MKKQKSKSRSRKSGKSKISRRRIQKPIQKIRNTSLDYPEIWVEETIIIFWDADFPFFPLTPCPPIPDAPFDKGACGEPLGRPFGPKVGDASLGASQRCYPTQAEGQGPTSGLTLCPAASASSPIIKGGFPVTPPSTITGVT